MKQTLTLLIVFFLHVSQVANAQTRLTQLPDRPEYKIINHYLKMRDWQLRHMKPTPEYGNKRVTSGPGPGFIRYIGDSLNGSPFWTPVAVDDIYEDWAQGRLIGRHVVTNFSHILDTLEQTRIWYQNNKISRISLYQHALGAPVEYERETFSYDNAGNLLTYLHVRDTTGGMDTVAFRQHSNLVLDNLNRVVEHEFFSREPYWEWVNNERVRTADEIRSRHWLSYQGTSNLVLYDSSITQEFSPDTVSITLVNNRSGYLIENPRYPVPAAEQVRMFFPQTGNFVPLIQTQTAWINQQNNHFSERMEFVDVLSGTPLFTTTSMRKLDFRTCSRFDVNSWLPSFKSPVVEERSVSNFQGITSLEHTKDSVRYWEPDFIMERENQIHESGDTSLTYELENNYKLVRYNVDSRILIGPKQSMIIGQGSQEGSFIVLGIPLPATEVVIANLQGKTIELPTINTNSEVSAAHLPPGTYLLSLKDAHGVRHTGRLLLR